MIHTKKQPFFIHCLLTEHTKTFNFSIENNDGFNEFNKLQYVNYPKLEVLNLHNLIAFKIANVSSIFQNQLW